MTDRRWFERYGHYIEPTSGPPAPEKPAKEPRRIVVDKRVERIRFEDETEEKVTIVIEPK